MPEFVLEGRDHAVRKESDFVRGFIEAMFFTNCATGITMDEFFEPDNQNDIEEGRADGCLPCDAGYTELHPDSLQAIRAYCERKQVEMKPLLDKAYERDYDETQAGRDLWFTVNGHGVGYWDRQELDADGLGDKLSEACGRDEINPFFGNHCTHGDAPFVHVDL